MAPRLRGGDNERGVAAKGKAVAIHTILIILCRCRDRTVTTAGIISMI